MTTREILKIDGVTAETKKALQKIALKRFGKANASLLVRELIAEELGKSKDKTRPRIDLKSENVRVELQLPRDCVNALEEIADRRISTRNYYINSIIFEHLGVGQLQGDEIETLRTSNYEMAKIGNNLNQIAKAFNRLVMGVDEGKPMPEIGKKMVSLRREIKAHTNRVLKILEAKTVIWETKGKGSRKCKR